MRWDIITKNEATKYNNKYKNKKLGKHFNKAIIRIDKLIKKSARQGYDTIDVQANGKPYYNWDWEGYYSFKEHYYIQSQLLNILYSYYKDKGFSVNLCERNYNITISW